MTLCAQRPLTGKELLPSGRVAAACHRMFAIILTGRHLLDTPFLRLCLYRINFLGLAKQYIREGQQSDDQFQPTGHDEKNVEAAATVKPLRTRGPP